LNHIVLTNHQQILPGEERPNQQLPAPAAPRSQEPDTKKKQKFVPLYSKEGQAKSVVQLPGTLITTMNPWKSLYITDTIFVCPKYQSKRCTRFYQ